MTQKGAPFVLVEGEATAPNFRAPVYIRDPDVLSAFGIDVEFPNSDNYRTKVDFFNACNETAKSAIAGALSRPQPVAGKFEMKEGRVIRFEPSEYMRLRALCCRILAFVCSRGGCMNPSCQSALTLGSSHHGQLSILSQPSEAEVAECRQVRHSEECYCRSAPPMRGPCKVNNVPWCCAQWTPCSAEGEGHGLPPARSLVGWFGPQLLLNGRSYGPQQPCVLGCVADSCVTGGTLA